MKKDKFPLPRSLWLMEVSIACPVLVALGFVLGAQWYVWGARPLAWTAAYGVLVVLAVWLLGWAPVRRFEVSERGLRIVHPLRSRWVSPAQIAAVEIIPETALTEPPGPLWFHQARPACTIAGVGRVKLYATAWGRFVLLTLRDGRRMLLGSVLTRELAAALGRLRTIGLWSTGGGAGATRRQ